MRPFLLAILIITTACDDTDVANTSRVASHTALHVRQHAVTIAQRMRARRPTACATLPLSTRLERWRTFTSTTQLQVALQGRDGLPVDPPLLFTLTRLRSNGDTHHLNLLEHTTYTTPHGETGTRTRELRRAAGQWFLREDSPRFIQAAGFESDGMQQLAESAQAFERLLALSPDHPECSLPHGTRRAWHRALPRELQLSNVSTTVERGPDQLPRRRTLTAHARLTDPTLQDHPGLFLQLTEEHQLHAEAIVLPTDPLPDQPVDRSYWDTRHLMLRVLARRALPPALDAMVSP